jgi:Domain of unknown function (DUF4145)
MLLSEVFENLAPFYIWAYNGPMRIVNFVPEYKQVGASGTCPHCAVKSYFRPMATYLQQAVHNKSTLYFEQNVISACECESCKEFVLVRGLRSIANPQKAEPFDLAAVYPIGTPNEQVETDVPPEIAEDFREALRCEWIKAYKACVVMCGRAVQASVIALGAKGGTLVLQIDDLAQNGIITEPLRRFAHAVRLTRNIGAHPDKDGLKDVIEKDAADMIEFTREFLHHVYVMPAKLKARFSEPAPQTAEALKSSDTSQT